MLIVAVVGIRHLRIVLAEVENGFKRTVFGLDLVGPKARYKCAAAPKGKRVNIPALVIWFSANSGDAPPPKCYSRRLTRLWPWFSFMVNLRRWSSAPGRTYRLAGPNGRFGALVQSAVECI